MFVYRVLTLFAASVLAAATLNAQNVIRNGGFTEAGPRTGAGDIPPNVVAQWSGAYQTPQLVNGEGCRDPNYIAMWGNKVVGEAIAQQVTLKKGVTYDVELCVRYRESKILYSHAELRASTAPLTSTGCPAGTCEAMAGAKKIAGTAWTPSRFEFTPKQDYAYLTVSATNDSAINDGAQVSWIDVDNISITSRQSNDGLAPLLNERTPSAIPYQYMVIFKPTATRNDRAAAEEAVKRLGGTIVFRYTAAIQGLGIKLPPQTSVQTLRALQGVEYLAVDQKVEAFVVQTPAPDGLDRIDRRLLTGADPAMTDIFTYSETGAGVHAYVIDTGIRITHTEFGTRAQGPGFTSINDGNGTNDCNGHGTHVAGTVGGTKFGVAKQVSLHPVRVLDCGGSGTEMGVVAGVDWVTLNRQLPAVANMSLGAQPGVFMTTLETAISTSIGTGITYVIAAGNWNADACTVSPARVPLAITVGATVPATDARAGFSDWGTCVDLFAPGVGIESAWMTSDTSTNTIQGTSMAAPHVAGAAALYLEENIAGTPASTLARIHYNDNVFSVTPNWPGVGNPGVGSPNELLHWGSVNDGFTDGDPHLTTVGGARYDFQGAGEFVLLRGNRDVEIQVRQTPIATTWGTCVSLNTAVAARVGKQRVTYQPDPGGQPNPAGLQVRVDGVVTPLGAQGITLAGGGRVVKASAGDGIELHFPDDTVLIVTPGWWNDQKLWYLNLQVAKTRATDGIMGSIGAGTWLPALPNGKSMGPEPSNAHQRYVDLYQTFADAWRVTPATALFDYASGTSTVTFTNKNWPPESGPCSLPNQTPVKPATAAVAQQACAGLDGFDLRTDCIYDVTATGHTGFAQTYLVTQQVRNGGTRVTIADPVDPTAPTDTVAVTAAVAPIKSGLHCRPSGTVQFFVSGKPTGEPVRLDAAGRARGQLRLGAGVHQLAAAFTPDEGTSYLPGRSANEPHTVGRTVTTGEPAVITTQSNN